jgi:hypothetical protein
VKYAYLKPGYRLCSSSDTRAEATDVGRAGRARQVHGHVNQPKAEKRGWPSIPAPRAALIRAHTRGRGTGTSTRPACSWRAPPRAAAPRGHACARARTARRRTPWAPARPCTGCTRSTCRGSSAGSTPAAPSPPPAPPFRHPARTM